MVVLARRKMEAAAACNTRTGWRSSPLTTAYYGGIPCSDDVGVDGMPVIVPCYNGKSLDIQEDLVVNGLSAISIKHHKGNCSDALVEIPSDHQRTANKNETENSDIKDNKSSISKLSDTCRDNIKIYSTTGPTCLREKMKRRNSFWNMHRPELSKLTWPQNFISSAMLQDFFHHHLRTHGTFCEPLHVEANQAQATDEEIPDFTILRELVPPTILPPDEKAVNIMEKSRSVQLNDEDLDPQIMVHKSKAQFCVTIAECARKPLLKRSKSHHMSKSEVQSTGRLESITAQKDVSLSEEELSSEEISSVIDHPKDVKRSNTY